ncbi:MAG: hypothetical protein K2W96_24645 [Gemmataceae bacterium]|nr:hypothetical protein [Gemmataceae bacterium]
MSAKPYDDTFKDLVERDPAAWAAWALGRPVTGATVIDSDLSTVTGLADKVIRQPRTGGDLLIAIEAESGHAGQTPNDALLYSVLFTHRHALPVRSILLLLRPEANATAATGVLERREEVAATEPYLRFTYFVYRVWLEPLAPLLAGPLALLPLAVLTNEARADIDGTAQRAAARILAETPADKQGKMISSMAQLLGMRYDDDIVDRVLRSLPMTEDNSYARVMMRRGAVRNAREMLIEFGRPKLGEPQPTTISAIESLDDPDRLRALAGRIHSVESWDALLAEETP